MMFFLRTTAQKNLKKPGDKHGTAGYNEQAVTDSKIHKTGP